MPDRRAPAQAAAEAAARAALRDAPETEHLANGAFHAIPGGLSNFAWQVVGADGECFVRLARHGDRLGADHANERRVLALTAAAGLSPPVVRCDPAAGLLVSRWVEALEPGRAVRAAGALSVVARAFASLHALDAPRDLRTVEFEVQARALDEAPSAPGDAAVLRACAADVFARLRRDTGVATLCHNDANPLNLLWERSGRLWLVDWEYAGIGDRALDLASFATQHGLDARRRDLFARAYRRAGGAIDATRLGLACWAFDYVQWLWYRAAHDRRATAIEPELARERAARLAYALRRRASRVLRCNNAAFGD